MMTSRGESQAGWRLRVSAKDMSGWLVETTGGVAVVGCLLAFGGSDWRLGGKDDDNGSGLGGST